MLIQTPHYFRAAFISIIFSCSALANEPLEEIRVTAMPFKTLIEEQSVQVNIIEGREKRRRQTLSLGDLLDDETGIANIATGAQAGKPVIRGFTGDRLRILNNGVAQEYQQFGVRHIANVNPFAAQRVEVIRGPISVLYGSGALGGVVNLLPRPIPDNASDELHTSGRLSGSYAGVNDAVMLGFETQGSVNNWGWTGSVSSNRGDDLETPITQTFQQSKTAGDPKFSGTLPFTDYEVLDGSIGLGYNGDFGKVSVRATHWNNEQNFLLADGSPVGQNLENSDVSINGLFWTQSGWRFKPSLTWQENIRQAATGVDYRELNQQNTTLDIALDRYSLKLAAEHPLFYGWRGEIGFEAIELDQDLRRGKLVPDTKQENQAIYLFEQKQFDSLTLQAGIRHDHISQTPTSDENLTLMNSERRSWSATTASFGANWKATPNLQWIGNISRGFRAPSIFELYANGVHGGVAAIQRGDTNLQEETSLNADLGLRWNTENTDITATLFFNRVDDYIYLRNTGLKGGPKNLPIYQADQEDAELWGAELSLDWQLSAQLRLKTNYSSIRGELVEGGNDLPLLPADRVNTQVIWSTEKWAGLDNIRTHLGYSYVWDKQAAGRFEPFAQFDNASFGTASTDAYDLWELGLGFDWPISSKRSAEIDIRVTNLTDSVYRDFLDTYKGYGLGPGRNIQVTLSLPYGG